jgi:Carboxypeptidase regulatory-like domain
MRRALAVLLSACITALALMAVSPSADAGTMVTRRVGEGQARTSAPAAAGVFIRGTVVNSVTKNPVRGVTVTVRKHGAATVDDTDVTNADGVFRLDVLTCEDDCALRINGSAKSYETGFRACNAQVVPTWGAACASPLGRIGRVFLDRE